MLYRKVLLAAAASFGLCGLSAAALADDHAFSEGPVSQVTSIRTVEGHFDDYMLWLDTVWKKEQEAAKKAGYIVGYEVDAATPKGENEADLYLIITYKNFAAMDDWIAKGDAMSKLIEGSVASANQSDADRAKIRRVLGSEVVQTLILK